MAKDPAVLFYTSDFLTGTSFLTYEQKGQYITLLCQQHQAFSIPENHMINICGSLDSPVVSKFIKDKQGNYYNKRMREEALKRQNFCLSRSNNKSGRPKKQKKGKIIRKSYENHMEDENEDEDKDVIVNVIEDLNRVLGSNYKHSSRKTQDLIKARLKEGFTLDDFKKVHFIKAHEWLEDDKMAKFLRPETLYSNKFEGYLNQRQVNKPVPEHLTGLRDWAQKEGLC